MRIAYLVSQYPAISHTFILREVSHLRKRGIEIHTASINFPDITPQQGTTLDREEMAETFYVKEQGFLRALWILFKRSIFSPLSFCRSLMWVMHLGAFDLKSLITHLFYLGEAALVGEWMTKKKLSHLHVHFANPASSVALLASKLFPISYSMTVHGPDEFSDISKSHLKEKIEEARFLCAISHFAKSQLLRFVTPDHWDKIEIAYLGVDLERYTPQIKKTPTYLLQILSVGRLTSNKGQRISLQAFHLYLREGGRGHFHLVGDGPDKEALREMVSLYKIQEHVTFHGALNQDETLKRYRQADLFLLSSFAEGLPVVLMEAMAMEIPCIATAINGIPELIRNESEGYLVLPADPMGIAAALKRLSGNVLERKQIGQASRRRIQEQFDLETNNTYLAEIFFNKLR